MNHAHAPPTARTDPGPVSHRCKFRLVLIFSAACVVFIFLFYAEEDWRGKKAGQQCNRSLRTQNIALNWTNYIPASVPQNQNIFGVPEMVKWFSYQSGAGWIDLAHNLTSPTYPGLDFNSNTVQMAVTEIMIGLPSASAGNGWTVLRWDDPASRAQAAKMIDDALGPIARLPQSPVDVALMLRNPDEVQPARIFLQCQTVPSEKEIEEFLPDSVIHATAVPERVLKFDSDGAGSYRVTMPRLARAADYLAWSDVLEPQFELIRHALERPSSQMPGLYANPNTLPMINFIPVRNLAQTLGARAQCHLLLGRPEEALADLTLLQDFSRRILAEQQPATFFSALVNGALLRDYAAHVGEGLRLQGWHEPQLIALQKQLKTMDALSPIKQAFTLEAVITYRALDMVPSAGMVKRTFWARLCPKGWGYEHVAARLNLDFGRLACVDTNNQLVFPDKAIAAGKESHALDRGSYTFVGSLQPIDFERFCQITALSQTRINEALIACALERFRLAHGEYPENLDALTPQFLDTIPHDVIGGQPLHYRRASEGTFVLYSVGWNGRDDGGKPGQRLDTDGDWVWPD